MYQNYSNFNRRPYNPKAAVKNFTDLEVYQKALEASVFVGSEVMMFLEASRLRAEVAKAEVAKSPGSKNPKSKFPMSNQVQSSKSKHTPVYGDEEFDSRRLGNTIIKAMCITAMSIPHLIAESHSKRFGASTECLQILDDVMLKCNKMVVYLEQTRDICQTGIETARFKEEIDKYFYIRRKVLNLQRVWRKYILENQNSNSK